MIIEIWGDNNTLIETFQIIGKNLPSKHTVNIKGIQQFEIRIPTMQS